MAPPPRLVKKAKVSTGPSSSTSSSSQSTSAKLNRIQTLEAQLVVPSPSSLNPLADLIHVLTSSSEPEFVFKALFATGRVLNHLIESGRLDAAAVGGGIKDEKEKVVVAWLKARLDEFRAFCGGLLKDEEKDLRVSVVG